MHALCVLLLALCSAQLVTAVTLSLSGVSVDSKTVEKDQARITRVAPGTLDAFVQLESLSLNYNRITSIPPDLFNQTKALKTLFLEYNQISSIPEGLLDETVALDFLSLKGNQITSIPPGLLERTTALQTLLLDQNKITLIPAGLFNRTTALVSLSIANNRIEYIPAGLFDHTPAIERVFLQRNIISSIPVGLLDQSAKLVALRLENNKITSIPAELFDNTAMLNVLFLHNNILASIPEALLSHTTNLSDLDFSYNHITSIPSDLLYNTSTLEKLSLHNNKIASIPASLLYYTPAIETVLLGYNQITSIPEGLFDQTTALVNVFINVNRITSIPSRLFDSTVYLQRAFLSENRITSIPPNLFDNTPDLFELFLNDNRITSIPPLLLDNASKLNEISIGGNRISSLPDQLFDYTSAMKHMTIIHNQITSIPEGLFDRMPNLRSILLAQNLITSIPPRLFDQTASLEVLKLEDNNITSIPAGLFDSTPNLFVLSLFNNLITSIPAGLFSWTANLGTLFLTKNRITSIPVGLFDSTRALNILRLDGNQITSVPSDLFDELSLLTTLNIGTAIGTVVNASFEDNKLRHTLILEQGIFPSGVDILLPDNACKKGELTENDALYLFIPVVACGACTESQFSVLDSCVDFSICDGNLELEPPTPSSDRVCVESCPLGTIEVGDVCERCDGILLYQDEEGASSCKRISLCASGTTQSAEPTPSTDRICTPCRIGTAGIRGECAPCDGVDEFQNEQGKTACKTPRQCPDGTRKIAEPTPTRDKLCGLCPVGTAGLNGECNQCDGIDEYQTEEGKPFCKSVRACSSGSGETSGPTPSSNRICAPCPAGKFSVDGACSECSAPGRYQDETGMTACKSVRVCGSGEGEVEPPTISTDRICADCAPGSAGVNGTCALCDGVVEFQDLHGATTCKSISTCNPRFEISVQPTRSSDRSCAACEIGKTTFEQNQEDCIHAFDFGDFLDTAVEISMSGIGSEIIPPGSLSRFTDLEYLHLDDNLITEISEGLFDSLVNLKELTLHDNRLTSIPDLMLLMLTSLEILSLAQNLITVIPAGLFDTTPALRQLYLDDNPLTTTWRIPAGYFGTTSLVTLTLPTSVCTEGSLGIGQFANVSPGVIDGCSCLPGTAGVPGGCVECDGTTAYQDEEGQMTCKIATVCEVGFRVSVHPTASSDRECIECENELSTIGINEHECVRVFVSNTISTDAVLISVQALSIGALEPGSLSRFTLLETFLAQDNQLTRIPSGLFDNNVNLEVLNLSGNHITSIPDGLFDNLASLQEVHLRGNDITSIPTDLFDNTAALTHIDFEGNTLAVTWRIGDGHFSHMQQLVSLKLPGNVCTEGSLSETEISEVSPDEIPGCSCLVGTAGEPGACEECDGVDSYQNEAGQTQCKPTTVCVPGSRIFVTPSRTSDRICIPCDGTSNYQDLNNQLSCKTTSTCSVGTFASVPSTATSNRICSACTGANVFQDEINRPSCKTASTCAAGSIVQTSLTVTSDRACVSCADGKYSDGDNQSVCREWTVCSSDEYEIVQPTATADRVCITLSICEHGVTANATATSDRVCVSPPPSSPSSSLSTGAIVGVTMGVIAFVVLTVSVGLLFMRRMRSRRATLSTTRGIVNPSYQPYLF